MPKKKKGNKTKAANVKRTNIEAIIWIEPSNFIDIIPRNVESTTDR